MALEDPFIGSGWSFPPRFDRATAAVGMAGGRAEIEQALRVIFTTRLGERIMRPDFGAGLDEEMFEALGTARLARIEDMARTAVLFHEPRIDLDDLSVTADFGGRLTLTLAYRVRGTNSRFNMVHPLYEPEGGDAG